MSRLIVEILLLLPFLSVVFISILSSAASAQSWSEGADMPTARSEITASNIGDEIFVIGGFDISGNPLDVVEVYNVKDDSWKSTASLPKPLHHTAAASYDGKIYVTGGFITAKWIPSNQLFIYDPTKNQWSEGKPMPTPRGALTTLFVNGTLYALGGQDEEGILNTNEAYDPIADSWTSKTPLPTARHHAASASIDNKIYVSGGRIAGSSPLVNVNVTEMYDTGSEKWRTIETMPSKRSGIAAASVNNSFFVLGGEDLTKTFDNNEKFDTQNDKWIPLEPMPTSRHGLAAVSINNKIIAIGGGPEPGLTVSDVNEIYSIK